MQINSTFFNFPQTKYNTNHKNWPVKNNLAPLEKDTVTFMAARKRSVDKKEDTVQVVQKASSSSSKKMDHTSRVAQNVAQKLYDESEYAFGKLKYLLSALFNKNAIDIDADNAAAQIQRAKSHHEKDAIVLITARRKHPNSISEKMAQQKIRSKKGALENLNDMIGARITVSGTSTKEGDYVIDKLTEAVKKNRVRIKKVKTHGQENQKLNYVTRSKINKLVTTARKNGSPLCAYVDEPRDSGYLAVHILTDAIEDGYSAEIQIIGVDVEAFKEIEDICYKCNAGKAVPEKYKPIEKLFKKYRGNKKLQEDYLEYTKRAYANERLKPAHKPGEFREYLKIPEDLNIPKELDFNHIAHLKEKIDNKKDAQ